MRCPLGWLRDYIDLPADTTTVVDRLAMLGFPVEHVEQRPVLTGILAGRLTDVRPHPNADRLSVCTVDVGAQERLTIATAATNVAIGQTVPVATVGAHLVKDGAPFLIELRKMRGIESEGMLCSGEELGFEAGVFEDGILQLEDAIAPGTDVAAAFGLCEDVLDVEVTANRVDVMSMLGIARELSAALGTPVREPVALEPVPTLGANDAASGDFRVTIETDGCRRFVAQRFSGVRVATSPAWMRFRLALAGQRPIDSLVDISNFVMLETGQPQHVYDQAKVAGNRLIARDVTTGESVVTLDGERRDLPVGTIVIADEHEVQSIAGLRGAAASEVTASTREIVVESANFEGPRVRRAGAALGLRTDASSRHERGLPLALADAGAARAALLLTASGAIAHPAFAAGAAPAAQPPVVIDPGRACALVGISLDRSEVADGLGRLGFSVAENADETMLVTPPYWRNDVASAADVAEEIARAVGYDRIAEADAPVFEQSVSSAEYLHERHLAHAFAAGGYREVQTLSLQPLLVYERWRDAGLPPSALPVEIANPLSEDQRYMRFALLPALLAIAGMPGTTPGLRIFEIGHVFERSGAAPFEVTTAAWLYVAPKSDEPVWRDSGFLTFKGEALAIARDMTGRDADAVTTTAPGLHPGKTASLVIDGKDVASIGAVDPRLLAAYEIDYPVYAGILLTHDVPAYRVPQYRSPSRFPAVERDLAVIVAPEIPAHEIEHAVRAGVDGVVAAVWVFDEYRGPQVGENRKSVAVRVRFQRDDATLTDGEVDGFIARVLASLRERVGAQIRE